MKKTSMLLFFAAAIFLLALGCSEKSNIVNNPGTPIADQGPTALISLPSGATIVSATFSVYSLNATGETVNVHRITAPWGESTVTWNNFGGAFDPTVVGSFVADAIGWHSVDVTSLIQDWADGTFPEYGLLIEQGATPYTMYISSEDFRYDLRPKLEICYSVGGFNDCFTIQRGTLGNVADAYVWETEPNYNGNWEILYTGLVEGTEKYSMFDFDYGLQLEPAAIGDRVWFDDNMNGIQDGGELGVPDVTVQLLDCDENVLDQMLTDADGLYLFSDLVPGDYLIRFIAPEGYTFTFQDQGGDDAVDSDANPSTGIAWCTTLEPGETDLTWDAGIYLVPMEGCTLTIGFWKTHAGFGPQPDLVTQFLPIWLGTPGGTNSLNVNSALIAVQVLQMKTFGVPKNGITKLYAQLLGAKLNIADGADYSVVSDAIDAADAFLAAHSWTEWDSLPKSTQKDVLGWMSMLDDYNNGIIGPGHCGD